MIEKLLSDVGESLSGVKAFLSGQFVPKADLDAATAKLAELATVRTDLEASEKLLAESEAKVAALTSENALLKADVDSLKAAAQTVDQAASKKAAEICAAQGIPLEKLTPPATGPELTSDQQLDALRAQMSSEPDPNKRAAIAAKCRELRGHSNLFNTETKA